MRAFYEQVQMDRRLWRFYAQCPLCAKPYYGRKVPVTSRGLRISARVQIGRADWLRQRLYNRRRTGAVQELALQFNFCPGCGRWVCDSCYDPACRDGSCINCGHL